MGEQILNYIAALLGYTVSFTLDILKNTSQTTN